MVSTWFPVAVHQSCTTQKAALETTRTWTSDLDTKTTAVSRNQTESYVYFIASRLQTNPAILGSSWRSLHHCHEYELEYTVLISITIGFDQRKVSRITLRIINGREGVVHRILPRKKECLYLSVQNRPLKCQVPSLSAYAQGPRNFSMSLTLYIVAELKILLNPEPYTRLLPSLT